MTATAVVTRAAPSAVARGPQRVLHLAHDGPRAGPVLVDAAVLADDREAPAQVPPHVVTGQRLVPPVPQGGGDRVRRLGGERLGVDRQPRLTAPGQDVRVVQVGVHQPGVDAVVMDQVAGEGDGLLDEPARDGGRWRRQRVQQALHLAAQPGQLGRRGAVQPAEQVADRGAGVVDRDVVQVAVGVEPLQQHVQVAGSAASRRTAPLPPHSCRARCSCARLRVRPGDLEARPPRRCCGAPAARARTRRAAPVRPGPGPSAAATCAPARAAGPATRRRSGSPPRAARAAGPRTTPVRRPRPSPAACSRRGEPGERRRCRAPGPGLGLQLGRPAHQPDQRPGGLRRRPRRRCRPRAGGRGTAARASLAADVGVVTANGRR